MCKENDARPDDPFLWLDLAQIAEDLESIGAAQWQLNQNIGSKLVALCKSSEELRSCVRITRSDLIVWLKRTVSMPMDGTIIR